MPEKGWLSITVTEELYEKLKVYAKKTCRSIPETVEFLLSKEKP